MESLQGQLLIASSQLLDPNFEKTVILLVQHSEQGALGLVINRPTSKLVKELWREVSETGCMSELPVYLGGPVSGPLIAVHTDRKLADAAILADVYFTATREHLDVLVQRPELPLKIFVGNAGWGAGQLDGELDQGAWRTLPATAEHIFDDDGDLWERVSKLVGRSMLQSVLGLKHIPDDPSFN